MKPKESSSTRSTPARSEAKKCATRAAVWCGLSRVVSITTSATERRSASCERSTWMPSASRPSPCSGCGRRAEDWRRTMTSSEASRKTTRGRFPRDSSCLITDPRSAVNARLRTSMTTAIRVTRPRERAPRSTIVSISSGGRLSTTNQPRSSITFAAVLRPAPERPETMATSMPPTGPSSVPSVSPSVMPLPRCCRPPW